MAGKTGRFVLYASIRSPQNTLPSGLALNTGVTDIRSSLDMCRVIAHVIASTCVLTFFSPISVAQIGPILIEAPAEAAQSTFEIGDIPEGEFTGFRQVIEKEELQQAGSSLAEVVAVESGVQFRQSGGLGSFSSVSLRGSSAEQVNVYLDGVLLNEASGGGVNFSDIELLQAEKVEIFRGTVPVQLGTSAIGGAVNITTARASSQPVTSLLASVGSFGSGRFSAAFTGPLNWLADQRLVASFSHRQSDNDFSFLNDNGTSFNAADDRTQRRNNAQTSTTSGFLKTGHRLANGARLEHAFQVFDRQQGVADFRNTVSGSAMLDTDNMQYRAVYKRTAKNNGWSSRFGAHYSEKNELFDDRNSSIGTGSQIIDSDTQVLGGRAYWEKVRDTSSLSINVRARLESFDSINRLRVQSATNAVRSRADLNVQWNRYVGTGSLFSASLFGFVVDDDYQITNNENARGDFNTSTLLPQLGFSHSLSDQWTLAGNLSRQKRVPSFFELFGSQGLFEGNAELSTETSDNVDFGLTWQSDFENPVDIAAEVSVFHSRREDLITRVYNARGVGRSENLARAQVTGVEFSQKATFENGFSLGTALTLQDAENRSDISGFTGKQLPGEASVDGALTASWRNTRWKFKYEYRINRDRFYDSANLLPAADQRVHSVGLSRYWKDWRLDVELNNLTDTNFEDFNGFPKPGRAGFISLFYQPQSDS